MNADVRSAVVIEWNESKWAAWEARDQYRGETYTVIAPLGESKESAPRSVIDAAKSALDVEGEEDVIAFLEPAELSTLLETGKTDAQIGIHSETSTEWRDGTVIHRNGPHPLFSTEEDEEGSV